MFVETPEARQITVADYWRIREPIEKMRLFARWMEAKAGAVELREHLARMQAYRGATGDLSVK